MAVGKKRHYTTHTIMPRHFLETGKLCGLPKRMVMSVMEELADTVPGAIDKTLSSLPKKFPEALAASITNAAKARAALLSTGNQKAE